MSAVTLELPDYLHRSLEQVARRHGLSVQQLLVSAAAEKAAALDAGALLREEGALGHRQEFDKYLRAVPDAPPISGDEI